MRQHDDDTIPDLIRGLLDDGRDLVRQELQLARAELREEAAGLAFAGVGAGFAAGAGLVGGALLTIAVGGALAYFFGFAAWIGYAIAAGFALLLASAAAVYARARARSVRGIAETASTIRDNITQLVLRPRT